MHKCDGYVETEHDKKKKKEKIYDPRSEEKDVS